MCHAPQSDSGRDRFRHAEDKLNPRPLCRGGFFHGGQRMPNAILPACRNSKHMWSDLARGIHVNGLRRGGEYQVPCDARAQHEPS
jgi:hypothetical protein